MENERVTVLLVREAQSLFGADLDIMKNANCITANDSEELIRFIYVHDPDLIVFNISELSEDNYVSLRRLKNDAEKARYRLIFLHSREEAADFAAAVSEGITRYQLKIFGMIEKNAQILHFLELRQDREEMQMVYAELKKATMEVRKKNKQLQAALNNLEKLTVTDYLTGIYNRRYILERIRQEIVRYKRNSRMFSFVICDIDNFKKVNDTYGHAFGDQVVIDTAKCLSETCREMDILARWGGDEFLFLLPETDMQGAQSFCERIQKVFEQRVFEYGHVRLTLALTFGIAEYDPKEGFNESIKNADNALLAGKNRGKNQVVSAS